MSDKTAALSEFSYEIDRIINLCEGLLLKDEINQDAIRLAIIRLQDARFIMSVVLED